MSVQQPERKEAAAAGPAATVNRTVFIGSAVAIVAFALWAMLAPKDAESLIGTLVEGTASWFGWFYIALATAILVFVVFLGASRYGTIKLGPEHSVPEFSTFSWAAMLFAAGIGTDLMFFAVAEPVTQYLYPPVGEGGTPSAARDATVWTMFHYGISGWGMYALMGMALAYFAYRLGLPLAIRSALYPLFGKRIHGPLGDAVDLAAVLGTIFGIATSLGIGVVQLNYGLNVLFDIPEGRAAQVGLIVLAVGMATVSAVSGIDRGIRRLSQLNVLLAIFLAAWVLVTGRTTFLLNAAVVNVGDYVSSFPRLTLETFPYNQPTEWLAGWTLFFWAWWIAWASFVGLFLARISRGRTIRQFVAGTLIIPFTYIVMWVSIFGNSALDRIRGGDEEFGALTVEQPQQGFYTLLTSYPAATFTAGVATFVGLLFYVTSADSGALVMGNLTSRLRTARDDSAPTVRIFWALVTGLLTMAMLLVGGIVALQNATVIMGLPFAFVMILVMVGLYRALRTEGYRLDAQGTMPANLSARGLLGEERAHPRNWRDRLQRLMALPDRNRALQFMENVAYPALEEVAGELRAKGVPADARRVERAEGVVDGFHDGYVELEADLGSARPFLYQIWPREAPVPSYGARVQPGDDIYWRLEVHLLQGGQGYDVMGYTKGQLINDVLDQYERHLEFLRLHDGSSP